MKVTRFPRGARFALKVFLVLSFGLILFSSIAAQQQPEVQTVAEAPTNAAVDAEAAQERLTRARALAAVGKRTAAAGELEALRAASADESVRGAARILLMGIYVEVPDYPRAKALLEEAFNARSASRSEASTRAYYALAGQAVNSARAHIERYRAFGINVADENLPADALNDLEQLRVLLESVLAHAEAIRAEESGTNTGDKGADATALIEEAANVRLRITRDDDDRARWKQEISEARQRLVSAETRIAKISEAPVAGGQVAPTVNASYGALAVNSNAVMSTAPAMDREAKAPATPTPSVLRESASSFAPTGSKAEPSSAEKKVAAPVSVGALNGKAERKIDPTYPSFARSARIAGVVTVYVVVDEKGSVASVQRAEGPVQLQTAATDAIRRWKFKPTIIDGQPVRVSGYINFNFSL